MPRNVTQAGMPNGQLLPLPIPTPGAMGLNLQQQNAVLPPIWAIESQNTVIDALGRTSARPGRTTVSSSASSGPIRTIFEYRTGAGTSVSIVSYDGGISSSTTAPNTASLVGTITSVANGRWYFANFLDQVVGFQSGQKPILMTSPAGTFNTIADTNAPQGGVGTAAYGRVWGIDSDMKTLKWSALADATNWTTGDSGSINLQKVWPQGNDTPTAVFAWNGTIAIAGLKQIVFYGSSDPTVLGLDVTQLQVTDVIEGTGVLSQWTVAPVGETDLIFCSLVGIQSLGRLEVNRSRPTTQLSKNVRDALIAMLSVETPANITGTYSPTLGFYSLSLPVSQYTWIADQRHRVVDEDGDDISRMTRWNFAANATVEFTNRIYFLSAVDGGKVAKLATGSDDGVLFTVILRLPWMDLGSDYTARLKALKRIGALLFARNTANVTFTWFVDFTNSGSSAARTITSGTNAEWGTAQWAIDQWSGGLLLHLLNVPASGTGQYFSLQIQSNTDSNFAVQQANLLAKLLRLA